MLKSLRTLELYRCDRFTKLDCIGSLEALEELDIEAWEQLSSVRYLALHRFPALKKIRLEAAEGTIPALSRATLPALKHLVLFCRDSLLNANGNECESKSDLLFTDDLRD